MPLLEKREHRPRIPLTPEIAEFIKANCQNMCLDQFAKKYGVSISKVQTWKAELNLVGTRAKQTRKKENHPR